MSTETLYQYSNGTNTSDTDRTKAKCKFWFFVSVPHNKCQSQGEVSYFARKNKCANVSAQEEHELKLKLESAEDLVQSSLYKIYFILL